MTAEMAEARLEGNDDAVEEKKGRQSISAQELLLEETINLRVENVFGNRNKMWKRCALAN